MAFSGVVIADAPHSPASTLISSSPRPIWGCRGQGPLPGLGVSPSSFFPSSTPTAANKKEKRVFWGHPYYLSPRQGARQGVAAPWNPALDSVRLAEHQYTERRSETQEAFRVSHWT